MKRTVGRGLIVLTMLWVAMLYGMISYRGNLFPGPQLQQAYHKLRGHHSPLHMNWSISIYEGPSPFDLSAPPGVPGPVLTKADVTDFEADFVADPFMCIEGDRYFMFFEALDVATQQGDICYAESRDGHTWNYGGRVIDEPFHLSYPCVYTWNGEHYIIPESGADLSVRLYRAVSFPGTWEYAATLLSGHGFVDPSVVRYNDKWWMLVSTADRRALNCYYSDDLLAGWQPHPMNPVVKFDRKLTSSGGRIVMVDGRLYRFAQDCRTVYGLQVFAVEITELTETSYAEQMAREAPVVKNAGHGWNAAAMHHVDPHRRGDAWIAAVDGRTR